MYDENQKTILLAEDNIIISKLTHNQLQELGYNVIIANSGENAIEVFEKNNSIDVVLMDINLGTGIDGIEAARVILKIREVPVIFLSSYEETEIIDKTEQVTPYGYVIKNSGIQILNTSIKMAFKLFKANRKIRESESILRSFFDTPGELRGIIDLVSEDDMRHIKCNSVAADFFGVTPEQMQNKLSSELGGPLETRRFWAERYEESRVQQKPVSFEYMDIRDDKESWLSATVNYLGTNQEGIHRYSYSVIDVTEKKLAKDKLIKLNEILKLAQTSSKASTFDWDLVKNQFYFSDEIASKYEFQNLSENSAEIWKDIIHPSDYDRVMENFKTAIYEKRDILCEFRIVLPNKEIHWIKTTGKVYYQDQQLTRIIGLIFDINREKEEESSKKEIEEQILLLSNNISNGMVYQVDSGVEGKDRQITFLSNTVEKLHEFTFENAKLDANLFYGQVIEPEVEKLIELENLAIQSRTNFISEIKFLLPSGKIRWGLFTSSPRRLANNHLVWDGVEVDITEIKEAESSRKEIEKQILMLSNNLPNVMICQVDSGEDGKSRRFSYLSNAVERLHEVTASEAQENPMLIYRNVIEPDLEKLNELENKAVETMTTYTSEVKLRLPSGKIRWGLIISSPRRLPNNHLVWDGVEIDITEKKETEEKILKLLEEKELLLKEVHHRIKNNIATIESILHLQLETAGNEETIHSLRDVIGRIQSMGILYERLSRNDNFIKTSFKDYLSKLVDEIISVFPNYLTVKIEKEIDDFIIEGKILFSLGIIINEIMTNLMKYSCVDKDDCVIKISASLSENKVRLIIHDNGVEFPYKFDHQISEGFGLSIINMLVMQLNGNIQYIADNGTKRILEFYI